MQRKTILVNLQLDAALVSEIESYGEKHNYPTLDAALVKALEEFFRDHRECQPKAA